MWILITECVCMEMHYKKGLAWEELSNLEGERKKAELAVSWQVFHFQLRGGKEWGIHSAVNRALQDSLSLVAAVTFQSPLYPELLP